MNRSLVARCFSIAPVVDTPHNNCQSLAEGLGRHSAAGFQECRSANAQCREALSRPQNALHLKHVDKKPSLGRVAASCICIICAGTFPLLRPSGLLTRFGHSEAAYILASSMHCALQTSQMLGWRWLTTRVEFRCSRWDGSCGIQPAGSSSWRSELNPIWACMNPLRSQCMSRKHRILRDERPVPTGAVRL